jgi:hypothetical protein
MDVVYQHNFFLWEIVYGAALLRFPIHFWVTAAGFLIWFQMWTSFFVIIMKLVIGCVEKNPGPNQVSIIYLTYW